MRLWSLVVAAGALAKPLVVDLETSWSESPHRVQVLETIANYNSSAFFPLLSLILSHEESNGKFSDSALWDFTIEKAVAANFLSTDLATVLAADVAMGTFTAAVESKFQTFYDSFEDLIDCENVLYYNGKATCDSDAVFALETDAKNDAVIFDNDRIIGGKADAPWAILYGDLSSPSFPVFHAHLLASALEGKINYILRYKPTGTKQKQHLGGFGVTAQVKRTDYLVVDDRDVEDGQLKIDVDAPNKLVKSDLPKLPSKVVTYILKQKDRFQSLKEVVLNLPSYLGEIKDTKISKKVKEDSESNAGAFFAPGTNTLLVNGAIVSENQDYNAFQFVETLRQELEMVDNLQKLGLDAETARKLITSGVVESDPEKVTSETVETRYDYRSNAIIWLNDLEKSEMYSSFPYDLRSLADPQSQLLTARRNAHNLVVAVDFENMNQLQLVAQLFQMVSRRAPFRVGIVPCDVGERTAKFLEVAKLGSLFARQKYLIGLLETLDPETALTEALKYDQDGNVMPIDDTIEQDIKDWQQKLGISPGTILANGYVIPMSQDWAYDAMSAFVSDDNTLRLAIEDGEIELEDTETDLEKFLLQDAVPDRNDLLDPADPRSIHYLSTRQIKEEAYQMYAEWPGKNTEHSVWIVGDLSGRKGVDQLCAALELAEKNFTLRALPVVNGERKDDPLYRKFFNSVLEQGQRPAIIAKMALESYKEHIYNHGPRPKFLANVTEFLNEEQMDHIQRTFAASQLAPHFSPEKITLVVDGRVVHSDEVLSGDMILKLLDREAPRVERLSKLIEAEDAAEKEDIISLATYSWYASASQRIVSSHWFGQERAIDAGNPNGKLEVTAILDPGSETAQPIVALLEFVEKLDIASIKVFLSPGTISTKGEPKIPNRYYQGVLPTKPEFGKGGIKAPKANFTNLNEDVLYVIGVDEPAPWVVMTKACDYDLDNVILNTVKEDTLFATYELRSLLIEGSCYDMATRQPPRGLQLVLEDSKKEKTDTMVMANLGYYQLQTQPGTWRIKLRQNDLYGFANGRDSIPIKLDSLLGASASLYVKKHPGKEDQSIQFVKQEKKKSSGGLFKWSKDEEDDKDVINVFTVASGHLYERFLSIMSLSVMKHTDHKVKFWLIENFLSPSFKEFFPELASKYNFDYEFITYKWPNWLRAQSEKQREIWGYKILFLDVLFPQSLEKVMFIDSDQIVRTDLMELVNEDLNGAPYGFTPMGEDRPETEGFRFWKQGYWLEFLKGRPYHISALYVVDLNKFREIGAGDLLRQHYQQLSADPESLANLDQDLPNNLQSVVPIHSLNQDWLWCETWCGDEGLKTAKTIDLCNNPLTKEPKLDRARRQIPEWNEYDETVAKLRKEFFESKATIEVEEVEQVVDQQEDEQEEHYEL